jgi:hypothetical protein
LIQLCSAKRSMVPNEGARLLLARGGAAQGLFP